MKGSSMKSHASPRRVATPASSPALRGDGAADPVFLSPNAQESKRTAALCAISLTTWVVAATVFVLTLSSNASAGTKPLPGDPHVCVGPSPAYCLVTNARLAARRHVGGPNGLYQGESSCTRVSRFTLTFSCQLGTPTTGTKTYLVRFTKGKTRWLTSVTP